MSELWDMTIHEAAELLRRREISSVELTKAHLARIDEVEGVVRAFLTLTPELALKQAGAADARLAAGEAVVVDGAEKLQDGAKVEPRERTPARTKS